MKTHFLILVTLFTFINFCFGQNLTTGTIKVARPSDTSISFFSAGFYLTIPDISKTQGFRLVNTDEFYYIGTEQRLTLRHLDTVYKEFDPNIKINVLNFKFDSIGTNELLDLTMKYQGQRVGLLLDNKLISVATISSPIGYGVMTLACKFTETEIDNLKLEIEDEARRIKMRRGTTRRKNG